MGKCTSFDFWTKGQLRIRVLYDIVFYFNAMEFEHTAISIEVHLI